MGKYILAWIIEITFNNNYRSPDSAMQLLHMVSGQSPYLADAPLSQLSYFFCEVKQKGATIEYKAISCVFL